MRSTVEISKRLVLINAGSSLLTRSLNIGVLVWLQQFLLRRITPEEYAIYPVVMAVMICVPPLTSVLTAGLGRFVVEAHAGGDTRQVQRIFSTMLPVLIAAGFVVMLVGGVLAFKIDQILNIEPQFAADARIMLGLLMFSAAVSVPAAALSVGLFVRQRFVLRNAILLGCAVVRQALLFVFLFGVSTRVLWVVVAMVVADLIATLITVIASLRVMPELRFDRRQIHWPVLRSIVGFGSWSFIGWLAYTLRFAAEPLILNRWGTPVDVTCLYLGSLPEKHIRQSAECATAPLHPQVTAMHATGDNSRLGRTYLRSCRYGLWFALALAMPLVVLRDEIVRLYVGAEFLDAATVMLFSLAVLPLTYAAMSAPALAIARGSMRRLACISLVANLAIIAMALIASRTFQLGAPGVAGASAIGITVFQPLVIALGLEYGGVSFFQWLIESVWRGIAPALAGAAASLIFQSLIDVNDWLSLMACAFAGMGVYAAVLLTWCLSTQERQELRTVRQLGWLRIQYLAGKAPSRV